MLTSIHIQHFAIVKTLSLDFQAGLHVLTGETGAGKSVWVDAIEIGLGARADHTVIYSGENTCDISLCFDLKNLPQAMQWLADNDLEATDECIIRRIIYQDKPSKTTLNGKPVPAQLIRELSNYLICVHSQHQHQELLKPSYQRMQLDQFGNHEKFLAEIQAYFSAWQTLQNQLQNSRNQSKNKISDLTLWQYQLEELRNLNLIENEYEILFQQYQALHQSKQFIGTLGETLLLLDNDDAPAANSLVQSLLQKLQSIRNPDKSIDNIISLLQTAVIHLEEARDALKDYCDKTDFQLDNLDQIEQRLTLLQDIARKHHITPELLGDIQKSLQQKITEIEKSDEIIAELEKKQAEIIVNYNKAAQALSHSREKAALKLSKLVTAQMQQLGMEGGSFNIILEKINTDINFFINSYGNEKIIFHISTNPGQPLQIISDIVSGGELSRISLILQVLAAQQKNTPTLIFDEVDVGIGGKTAETVGKLLRELALNAQVLCVTHLAQVAAFGEHHFKAEKMSDGKSTSTTIYLLNTKNREQEIARMLSGSKITEKSLLHAKELLEIA